MDPFTLLNQPISIGFLIGGGVAIGYAIVKDLSRVRTFLLASFGVLLMSTGLFFFLIIEPSRAPNQIVLSLAIPENIMPTQSSVTEQQNNSSSQSSTQSENPNPTSADKPAMSVVTIPGDNENGTRINVPTAGTYQLSYEGGAYSPWSADTATGYRGWTTTIRVYINKSINWGMENGYESPIKFDCYLGTGDFYLDKEQAISASYGFRCPPYRLNSGDYIILVPLDEKGAYTGNRDEVDIGITYLGQ